MNVAKHTIAALLLAVVASGLACSSGSAANTGVGAGHAPKSAPLVQATRVEAARVEAGEATIRLVRPGEVEPVRESRVASALGGAVEAVLVDVGELVKAGQILARIDTRTQAANLQLVRVEVKEAKRELARLQSLGASTPQARVDAAETRVERAEAQLALARIQQGRSVIKAPFAGVVAEVGTEVGEVLAPGMLVARIIQVDPAVISVSVADRDVGSLRVDGKALVTAAGLPAGVEGIIRRIDPAADLKTRTFTVELEVTNAAGALRPGMIANVDFRQQVAAEAILLPQDFLVTRLDENGVFVVGEGDVASWRPLTLGQVIRDQVVVEQGLRPGERIVTLGHRGLADGDVLLVARDGVCCSDGRVVHAETKARAPTAAEVDR